LGNLVRWHRRRAQPLLGLWACSSPGESADDEGDVGKQFGDAQGERVGRPEGAGIDMQDVDRTTLGGQVAKRHPSGTVVGDIHRNGEHARTPGS
jgi:hypothetical protein